MTFQITQSIFLDNVLDKLTTQEKTTLEKIDYLNKLRLNRRFYGWGRNLVDNMVNDQPSRSLTFEGFIHRGQISSPVKLYWDNDYQSVMIDYPTISTNSSPPPYVPNGSIRFQTTFGTFITFGQVNKWSLNSEYESLIKQFRKAYAEAWLNLKRKKVNELKNSLDSDSINEFIAVKRAIKTQAIIEINIQTATLMSKLENYQRNISTITNPAEANSLFNEVETLMIKLKYMHERNVSKLNNNPRIPGGKKVKNLINS
jgi:hypothetical protein